jgi:hypothetical protein
MAATAAIAGAAHAGAAWEFTTASRDFTDGTWDFATAFTVNSNVTASGLGYYASPTNGQVDANPVALYRCDTANCIGGGGTLIASAIVDNTYPLLGHFRYVTINPVNLIAGEYYEVAGISFGNNYTWGDIGFATDPAVSIVPTATYSTRWQGDLSTPDFLNYLNTAELEPDGFWGPNVFLGSATGFTGGGGVPEPASWALMIGGFGLAGAALRRRKTAIA